MQVVYYQDPTLPPNYNTPNNKVSGSNSMNKYILSCCLLRL